MRGLHNSPSTEFKKGMIPWNKGKKGVQTWTDKSRMKVSNTQDIVWGHNLRKARIAT